MIARLKEGLYKTPINTNILEGVVYRAYRVDEGSIVLNGLIGLFPLYYFDLWDSLEEMESDTGISPPKSIEKAQLPSLGSRVEMFGKSWIFSMKEDHSRGGSNITFAEIVWPWVM